MPLLDRRIKQCPNESCDKYKKAKYKPSDLFCASCGTELVFVCKKCGSKIVDEGPSHTLCDRCDAIKQDKRDKIVEIAKEVAATAGTIGTFLIGLVNLPPEIKEKAQEVVKKGASLIKK